MNGAIGRKEQVRGKRCSWRSTDSKLFSQCSASLINSVLGAKWRYKSHRWDGFILSWDTVVLVAKTCTISSTNEVQCQDPGMMLDPETDLRLGPDLGSRWLCAQGEWPIPEQGLKPEPVTNPVTSQGYYSVLLYKWLNWSGRRPNSLQCEGSNQCSVQLQSR